MKKSALKILLTLGMTAGTIDTALAHANFVPKDNLDFYNGRDYQEGSTAYLSLNLSHGCSNADGSKSFPTRHAVAIMPNDKDLEGIAFTKSHSGDRYGANGLMSVRPEASANWKIIKNPKAPVGEYYSHGLKNEDVGAIQWIAGHVPPDFYSSVNFRAQVPYLEGCVSKLKVHIPTVQYCSAGHVKAWFKEATPSMPEHVVSTGYAPYINVIRAEGNALAPECGEEGLEKEVYPSVEHIEKGLLPWRNPQ